jgi:F0F1-type ATP synthase assembly protein I
VTNGTGDKSENPERNPAAASNGAKATTPAADAAKKQSFLMAAARYTAVASSLPAAIIAGYIIGYALDKWLHTEFLKIVFLVLGIIAGFMDLIRQLMKDMQRKR